ncbi:hypothetical protein [Dongshaea marina]|uniref:hypothetical protein n=1 Tax=Dongshaea marina TaxID=2047966 RepID=UPI00131F0E59|nr:hypothetical protein [Dongshaea marina]
MSGMTLEFAGAEVSIAILLLTLLATLSFTYLRDSAYLWTLIAVSLIACLVTLLLRNSIPELNTDSLWINVIVLCCIWVLAYLRNTPLQLAGAATLILIISLQMELDALSIPVTLALQAGIIYLALDLAILKRVTREPSRLLLPFGSITALVLLGITYETELSLGVFQGLIPAYVGSSVAMAALLLAAFYLWRRYQCQQQAVSGAALLEHRRKLAENHQLYRLSHNPDDEWPQSKRCELDEKIQLQQEKQNRRLQMDANYRNNLFRYPEMKIANRERFDHTLHAELSNPEALRFLVHRDHPIRSIAITE